MYHGTSHAAADLIMQEGFKRSTDGMLGPGVYLSRDVQKTRPYAVEGLALLGIPGVIFKCRVRVGKVQPPQPSPFQHY